ncbi:MAG TPA: type II toxin-antitoxin system prevent-host-death family antitoxin [Solirubrobacteraceae bacterium]|nr:type II toxin-antitoxin system prevent-host-death family antitoxin [Solirubrobacteraceae bacterium]
MDISVRGLRNRTRQVIAAVQAGQRVALLNRGTPVVDVVPSAQRTRWLPGSWLGERLARGQADPALTDVLNRELGQTIDEEAQL